MPTEYKESDHSEFIQYLYCSEPKPKGTITLESPLDDPNKNINLHIFEQLLMIFVDGLKFFYGNEQGKVNLSELTKENIQRIDQYFQSMNYKIHLEYFETIHDYQFKFPNYFRNQDKITKETKLEDFYYEVYNENNCAYRISFLFN